MERTESKSLWRFLHWQHHWGIPGKKVNDKKLITSNLVQPAHVFMRLSTTWVWLAVYHVWLCTFNQIFMHMNTLKYLPKEFPWKNNSFCARDLNFIWDLSDTGGRQPLCCSEWSYCVTCGPWVLTPSAAISICMVWKSSRNVNTWVLLIEHAVMFYWKSSIQWKQKTLPLKILFKPCRFFCLFTSFS